MNISSIKKHITPVNTGAAILIIFLSAWTLSVSVERMRVERLNKTVEICIDWDESEDLCRRNNYSFNDFLERCKAIGVQSAAINEETLQSLIGEGKIIFFPNDEYLRLKILDILSSGSIISPDSMMIADANLGQYAARQLRSRYQIQISSTVTGKYLAINPAANAHQNHLFSGANIPFGFSKEKIDMLFRAGLKTVLRPQNNGNPSWLLDNLPGNVSGILWDSKEAPGYPGNEQSLEPLFSKQGIKFIDMEFTNIPGAGNISNAFPSSLVRGHSIPPAELNRNINPTSWLSRWNRAVRERNIRFLFFHFYTNVSVEDNLSYLRDLAQGLKKNKFVMGESSPPPFPVRGNTGLWVISALICALLFPVMGLYSGLKNIKPHYSFLIVNLFSMAGGLLVSALFYDVFFMQKITDIPAIRLCLFMPVILSVFIVYKPQQLKKFWSGTVHVKHLFAAISAALLFALLLARSGNNPAAWLSPETTFRQFVENLLIVRPRTKEFLFGQPLLYLGLYFKNPALILLGMVGQVSIINTFMHAHTPLFISIIRTLHGIWLGFIIGFGANRIIEFFKRKGQ